MKLYFIVCFILAQLLMQSLSAQTYTAIQLYNEKRSNSARFDEKYFNKAFTVTGKIIDISPTNVALPGFSNVHKVAITATGTEFFIICQIPFEQKSLLTSLSVGAMVTVKGTYNERYLQYVVLNNCELKNTTPDKPSIKKEVPSDIPFGKYSVYQQDATGFSYQYQLQLSNYKSYIVNGKSGTCNYNSKTKVIKFTTGLLKGFTGIYRPANPTNENDPPTIVLDAKGNVPDLNKLAGGYQYAYSKE